MDNITTSEYESIQAVFTEIKINYYYLAYRRVLELALIIVSSPLWISSFIILSITIFLYYGKSPLYLHKRVGYLAKPFYMLKFRSTEDNDFDCSDNKLKPNNYLGKFLRRHHLDEIPQFINIILGDMSLIGPRPFPEIYDRQLFAKFQNYHIRYYVKPGLTGLWQVAKESRDKINYDITYLNCLHPENDFQIIKMTIKEIIKGK